MSNVSSAKSSSPAKSSTPQKSATPSKSSTSTNNGTSGSSTARNLNNGNSATDRVDVNFKPEKEVKSGVNLDAWGDDSPAPATGQDDSAALKEALGDKTLRNGMQGDNVKALQTALNEKLGLKEGDDGYLDADGKFGPKTASAVKDFQKQNEGLKQDGIFGPNTRDALLSPSEKAEASEQAEAAQTPEGKPAESAEQPAEASPQPADQQAELAKLEEALGTNVMRKGAQGDNVKALQEALNQQLGRKEGQDGFLEVDGKFGRGTMDAVKEFQRQKEIGDDGIVGKNTRDALLGREVEKAENAQQPEQSAATGETLDRYAKYEQHRELLARAIAAEARGEGFDTQVAVAQTIMNYANDKGKNLTSLVGNRNSAFLSSNKDGNKKFYTMSTGNIPNWERTLKAVDQALAGQSAVGADRIYFHDNSIGAPRWVDPSTRLALGKMRFYEER